jgi:uncharacterized membrane protein
VENSKKLQYISYIGPLWLAGLFGGNKWDKTLRYHVNQGFMLFLAECALIVAYIYILKVPFAGELLGALFAFIFFPVCVLYIVIGILNVMRGKLAPLPYIGIIKIFR